MASVEDTARDLTQSLIAKFRDELKKNAEVYANARAQSRLTAKPNQILSEIGFKEHPLRLSLVYYPPRPGEYKVMPNKKLRPWRYICLHVGDTGWDKTYLNRTSGVAQPPGDENGHNEARWARIIQQYILPQDSTKTRNPCSTHYCVSRKGDVIASVDLNDIAYHMPRNYPK